MGEVEDISHVNHLVFGFFICPCYSRGTHPMLWKLGVKFDSSL